MQTSLELAQDAINNLNVSSRAGVDNIPLLAPLQSRHVHTILGLGFLVRRRVLSNLDLIMNLARFSSILNLGVQWDFWPAIPRLQTLTASSANVLAALHHYQAHLTFRGSELNTSDRDMHDRQFIELKEFNELSEFCTNKYREGATMRLIL